MCRWPLMFSLSRSKKNFRTLQTTKRKSRRRSNRHQNNKHNYGSLNMSWVASSSRFKYELSKVPRRFQVEHQKKNDRMLLPGFKGFLPTVLPKEKQLIRFEAGIMEGDLAYVTEGPHKGKVVEVLNYAPEYDCVSLANVSSKRLIPKPMWPEGHTSHVFDFPDYVPRDKVRVVGKDRDEQGQVRYVVAEKVVMKEKYYDDRFKQWIPRRYIKYHDYELPWPQPQKINDGALSTPEAVVREKTFEFNTIGKSTIPKQLVNQLRNPYSKFKRRTLSGFQIAKLKGPEMPLTMEQKIWLAKQADKPAKKLVPLSEEVQEFIGAKMAQHMNRIESPALRLHLEALSNQKIPDYEKTLQLIEETAKAEQAAQSGKS